MPRISQLDPHIVNKIAAGEVIERPASVIKELLENSVDALATRIDVEIAAGGSEQIRITDNGEGIHPDDLLLAVTSHATSKIRSDDDLFHVQTMGFRGEALASIASVSRLAIRSRQADAQTGSELVVDSGRIGEVRSCGAPFGTQIEITQLFANTPVRRKFLKTVATEFGHITEQFTRIALANPRLHLVLRHNGKTVYELPPTDSLRDRLQLFYGRELVDQLIEIEGASDDVRLWGYVAHPSQSKATRKSQSVFLNGRWIQDRSLQHAISESYRGLMMVGRHPIVLLFFEMPASRFDVNVHPTKVEVRFRDPQQLYRLLLSTIRSRFLSLELDSEFRLPERTGVGAQSVSPMQQSETQLELTRWAKSQLGEAVASRADQHDTDAPGEGRFLTAAEALLYAAPTEPATSDAEAEPGDGDNAAQDEEDAAAFRAAFDEQHAEEAEVPNEELPAPSQGVEREPLPMSCRAMQVHDCYLVVETPEGVSLIDQHALHERIMYEYLRPRVLAGKVEAQKLLVPESLELSPKEAALLLENTELLAQFGLAIEEFGKNTILINSYPVMLSRAKLADVVRDLIEQLDNGENKPTHRDLIDRILHTMSCRAAIKAGQRLSPEEIESLLAQRHLVDDAHHCPHGRPTALKLSRNELDRQFGRLG